MGLIIILIYITIPPAQAQTSTFRLKIADSLFQAKRYTQSLEHYDEILRQNQYTPAMLLKMAYIHEGLNQVGSAMYYLNLYHLATDDEAVLEKMDEMAAKNDLEGYVPTDTDRAWAFYRKNSLAINLTVAALMIFFLSLMYYIRVRLHKIPIGTGIDVAILSIVLISFLVFGDRMSAVIATQTTYLMDGPSAGASVIDIVGDGHRVEILGKKDVWLKIRWDGEIAYVKENSVRPLRL